MQIVKSSSQVARQFSVLEEDLESYDEKINSFWQSFLQSYAFSTPDTIMPPQIIATSSALFKAEKTSIETYCKERSSVIIGRCGSHILRKHPNHDQVFFYMVI